MRDSRVKRNKNLADVLTEAKNYMDKKTEEKIEFWSSKGKPVRWPKIFVVLRMYWKVRTLSSPRHCSSVGRTPFKGPSVVQLS